MIVAGAIAAGEFILGWETFELGGMVVVPYLIPLVLFIALMIYSADPVRTASVLT